MAEQNRINLKAQFEDGDTITEDSMADLIDSCLNLQDTTAQTISSNLIVPNIAANTVSAQTIVADTIMTDLTTSNDPYCEMWSNVTAATSAAGFGAFVQFNIATTAASKSKFLAASGVATYNTVVTSNVQINYKVVVSGNHSGERGLIAVFKNGTKVSSSEMPFLTGGMNQLAGQCVIQMANNDTVDLRIAVVTTTQCTYTTEYFSIIAHSINWS